MSKNENYGRRTFELPIHERWGLTSEEQVVLFGDQGAVDKYSSEAFRIILAKHRLGIRYLISFWPPDEIPTAYAQAHDEALKHHAELVAQDDWFANMSKVYSPLEAPIGQDLQEKYEWKKRNEMFDGAAARAVEYARSAAAADSNPQEAIARLEYILKISKEMNEFGWRCDNRGGGGVWVDFPDAPWQCDSTEYPRQHIDGLDERCL